MAEKPDNNEEVSADKTDKTTTTDEEIEEGTVIEEGMAKCVLSKGVFYNPVQEFNRDLSIVFLRTVAKRYRNEKGNDGRLKLLEAMAASGVRSARYAVELRDMDCFELHANDIDKRAVDALRRNLGDYDVTIHCKDACRLMWEQLQFHVIDIDPFGSPTRLLESAMNGLKKPGLLTVTATDAAVLCTSSRECQMTCFAKYGARPAINNPWCHEFALRIMLYSILQTAARFGCYIQPQLSMSADFYFRVFVEVRTGLSASKKQLASCLHCVYCNVCLNYEFVMVVMCPPQGKDCMFCGSSLRIAGPIWGGPLHSKPLLQEMLQELQSPQCSYMKTRPRMIGVLSTMSEELDCPSYLIANNLCKKVNVVTPSMKIFRSAIKNAGYAVSSTHCDANGMKTDAPFWVPIMILKEWAKKKADSCGKNRTAVALRILAYDHPDKDFAVDFTIRPDALSLSKSLGLKRFPPNPEPFWGPRKKPRGDVEKASYKPGKAESSDVADDREIAESDLIPIREDDKVQAMEEPRP